MHPAATAGPAGSGVDAAGATWPARTRLIDLVAALVPRSVTADCVRVGVDGVDGAGKTCFADELAGALRELDRPVVRVRLDDFHNLRAVRHRRGAASPSGFWLDSYDYPRLWADVLSPLGPGGSRQYRPASHDLATDQLLRPVLAEGPGRRGGGAGRDLLHRDELAGVWDLSVFLDVGFGETARRMAARDGSEPNPAHPSLARYQLAQRHYLTSCRPWQRADVVIDNSVLAAPELVSFRPRSA